MIDRLQITIEPDALFCKEADKNIITDLRIEMWFNGEKISLVEKYVEDEFKSLFDQIFTVAQRRLKGEIMKKRDKI